jgi:hypothetical protein
MRAHFSEDADHGVSLKNSYQGVCVGGLNEMDLP